MNENTEAIHTFTRAQAIAGGELRDATETAREAGFSLPVALTRAAWVNCVEWDDSNAEPEDEAGRLWDVLWMARLAAQRAPGESQVNFQVLRTSNERREDPQGFARNRDWGMQQLVSLTMTIGPGDIRAPVITIMEEDED